LAANPRRSGSTASARSPRAGHLNAAVAQDAANGADAVAVTLVLYDLPNRNCQAPVGSSELSLPGGLDRYKVEFIDAIRAILSRSEYAALRIAVVVEPWSLYSQVVFEPPTQFTTLRCVETHQSGVHRDGIRYAINQLGPLANTYMYVDGTGTPGIIDEDDPFKRFDPMCDPLQDNRYEDEVRTGAMAGGPHLGRWFPAQFEALVRNAYPPVG
jgi:cellulase/cellobiase CelA1